MRENTFVEFVGVPGGGKSTLARRLQDRLSEQGVAFTAYADTFHSAESGRLRRAVMLLDSLAFLLARPALAWLLARLWVRRCECARFPAGGRRRKLLKFVALSAGVTRNLKTGAVILDQGPLQCLMSWIWTGGHLSDAELRQIAGAVFPPAMKVVFVHVDTDPDIAFQRASGRKDQQSAMIRGRTPDESREMFRHASATVHTSLRRLDQTLTIRVHDETVPFLAFRDLVGESEAVT